MGIAVRCFSCGKVLGDKWEEYNRRVQEKQPDIINEENQHKFEKNFKGLILDDLKIKRQCCRALMLCQVETNQVQIYQQNQQKK